MIFSVTEKGNNMKIRFKFKEWIYYFIGFIVGASILGLLSFDGESVDLIKFGIGTVLYVIIGYMLFKIVNAKSTIESHDSCKPPKKGKNSSNGASDGKWFIAIITIIISIVGLFIAYSQTRIYSYQTQIYEQQMQPHFQVVTYKPEQWYVDDFYEGLDLMVYNSGNSFYDLEVTTKTFLEINFNSKNYAMPLDYFFAAGGEKFGDEGTLVYRMEGYQNNLKVNKLYKSLKKEFEKDNIGIIREQVFIKITYQDSFAKYHTQYFDGNNGRLLTENKGEEIFRLHKKYLEVLTNANIDEVNVDQIMKYIGGDQILEVEELF